MASDRPKTTAAPLSDLERVYVLEAVMQDNGCIEAQCVDWHSEHCECRIQFEEICNGR